MRGRYETRQGHSRLKSRTEFETSCT